MFIEPGVKISGAYYRDVLLGQHLLPAIRSVAGDFFTYRVTVSLMFLYRALFVSQYTRFHLTFAVAAQ